MLKLVSQTSNHVSIQILTLFPFHRAANRFSSSLASGISTQPTKPQTPDLHNEPLTSRLFAFRTPNPLNTHPSILPNSESKTFPSPRNQPYAQPCLPLEYRYLSPKPAPEFQQPKYNSVNCIINNAQIMPSYHVSSGEREVRLEIEKGCHVAGFGVAILDSCDIGLFVYYCFEPRRSSFCVIGPLCSV